MVLSQSSIQIKIGIISCLTLMDHQFVQSISRKGNCLDKAPVESFFHLYKTELLVGFPPCKDIAELKKRSQDYVQYFNSVRTTLKTKGMTPV